MELLKEETASYKIETIGGASILSDIELVALICWLDKKAEGLEVVRKLFVAYDNSIVKLTRASISDLIHNGLTAGQAKVLHASFELIKRRRFAEAREETKVTSSKVAFEYIYPSLCDLDHEEFYCLYLNRANHIIGHKQISKRGITGTVVDPGVVFRHGIQMNAKGMILCHNHPSGNLKPSEADITLTKKIKDGGALLEITVLDHLIVGGSSYYSFADESKL